jgi:hypothetical protein
MVDKEFGEELGERYSLCNIVPRLSFNGDSIMVWGGISANARTDLVLIDRGAINAHTYIEDVLLNHVVTFAPLIGNNFILMGDNARPHMARVVNEFLDEVGISRMEWPPKSPDLNPIEHVRT